MTPYLIIGIAAKGRGFEVVLRCLEFDISEDRRSKDVGNVRDIHQESIFGLVPVCTGSTSSF
jgi:hypothetical protein